MPRLARFTLPLTVLITGLLVVLVGVSTPTRAVGNCYVDASAGGADWMFRGEPPRQPVQRIKEYRHTLGTLINGLVEHGFTIVSVSEEHLGTPNFAAPPGTLAHFSAVVPLWLNFWAAYRSDSFGK